MCGVGPSLHQSIQGLVVSLPLDVRKSKDEVFKPSVLNTVPNIVHELIVPHVSTMEVPSILESVGIEL